MMEKQARIDELESEGKRLRDELKETKRRIRELELEAENRRLRDELQEAKRRIRALEFTNKEGARNVGGRPLVKRDANLGGIKSGSPTKAEIRAPFRLAGISGPSQPLAPNTQDAFGPSSISGAPSKIFSKTEQVNLIFGHSNKPTAVSSHAPIPAKYAPERFNLEKEDIPEPDLKSYTAHGKDLAGKVIAIVEVTDKDTGATLKRKILEKITAPNEDPVPISLFVDNKKMNDGVLASKTRLPITKELKIIKDKSTIPRFKVVITGASGVGKSSFAQRSTEAMLARRSRPDLKVEIYPVTLQTSQGPLILEIWDYEDPGNPERHPEDEVYLGAHAAILMFSVTERTSYKAIPKFYRDVCRCCDRIPMVLCGNKVDLSNRKVKAKHICFHRKKNLMYYDVSAKANYDNVMVLLYLARKLTNSPNLQLMQSVPLKGTEAAISADAAVRMAKELAVANASPLPDDDEDF